MERPLSIGVLRFFIPISFEGGLGCRRLRRRISLICVDESDRVGPEPTGKRFVESPAFYKRESGGQAACRTVCPTDGSSRACATRPPLCPLQRAICSTDLPLRPGLGFQVPAGSPQSDRRDLSSFPVVPRIRYTLAVVYEEGPGVCCCNGRSIAHTKPASSRTTAMIATGADLPRSIRCR